MIHNKHTTFVKFPAHIVHIFPHMHRQREEKNTLYRFVSLSGWLPHKNFDHNVMKWIKTTASSSVSLHFIYNCCSISMPLWAPEYFFVWLCYCLFVCVCVCVLEACISEAARFYSNSWWQCRGTKNTYRFFFPALPTGINLFRPT